MPKRSESSEVAVIGLDLGDRWAQRAQLDVRGGLLREDRLPMQREALLREFSSLPRCRVVLEAGTHSPWVSRLLQQMGHEVIVANPRKLALIYADTHKSDRRDARVLAELAHVRPALLSPIRHRSAAAQADLAALRARDALVRSRTLLINHLRGAVKAFGGRLPARSSASCHSDALAVIPAELRPALEPLVQSLAMVTAQIRDCERRIRRIAQRHPATEQLSQVHGVGLLTALAFVLTIEDPRRFRRSRTIGAYLGLAQRQKSSGLRDPELGITKAGDPMLRRLLVQCAHYILGPFCKDCDLRRFGQAIADRGPKSAKKRAIVAVARKLAVLLHRLWITGEIYDPLRQARRAGSLRTQAA